MELNSVFYLQEIRSLKLGLFLPAKVHFQKIVKQKVMALTKQTFYQWIVKM